MSMLIGFALGFAFALYAVVWIKQRKEKKSPSKNAVRGKSAFINFFIVDKSEAIQNGVEDKLGAKFGKGFLRDKIASTAGKIAARNVSDEKVANTMSGKISSTIPEKMLEMGIVAEASKVYGAGPFFVVKLTLLSVDLEKLVGKAAGKQKATMFEDIMNLLGGNWAKESLGERILPMILSKIQEKLPEKMKEKMSEKGLLCEITVKSEQEEAQFFFEQVNVSVN